MTHKQSITVKTPIDIEISATIYEALTGDYTRYNWRAFLFNRQIAWSRTSFETQASAMRDAKREVRAQAKEWLHEASKSLI